MEIIPLNSSAAAAYLGITKKALYALVERGLIPHRRRGRILLFLKHELSGWMDQLEGLRLEEITGPVVHTGERLPSNSGETRVHEETAGESIRLIRHAEGPRMLYPRPRADMS